MWKKLLLLAGLTSGYLFEEGSGGCGSNHLLLIGGLGIGALILLGGVLNRPTTTT
jgi:hypothetical protein